MKLDEYELKSEFEELKTKDVYAFNRFYDKYNRLVYSIAFSILKNIQDTEDVVQIVFIKMYELDSSKFPTSKEASWIYSFTKNEAISYIRKNRVNVNIEDIYEIANDDYYIERIMSKDAYNRLISNISELDKEIVSLKVLSSLTFEQIGKFLGKPTGTVKWRYYRAVDSIKILIGNIGLFIVTFVIGLKNIFEKKSYEINNSGNDKNTEGNKENTKQEDTEKDVVNDILENNIFENDIKQEVVIEKENNINYVGITFISVSMFFLIISIFFIKKYKKSQLKHKAKSSK